MNVDNIPYHCATCGLKINLAFFTALVEVSGNL